MIGVAGVMGGAGSEVAPETRDIFLECAFFEPSGVRRARRALDLSTEASYRFERGVDRWNGPEALRRCVELVLVHRRGRVVRRAGGPRPGITHPPRIFLRPDLRGAGAGHPRSPGRKSNARWWRSVPPSCPSRTTDGSRWMCPAGGRTCSSEIDLIEEVARVHGYDAIPDELRAARPGSADRRPRVRRRRQAPSAR